MAENVGSSRGYGYGECHLGIPVYLAYHPTNAGISHTRVLPVMRALPSSSFEHEAVRVERHRRSISCFAGGSHRHHTRAAITPVPPSHRRAAPLYPTTPGHDCILYIFLSLSCTMLANMPSSLRACNALCPTMPTCPCPASMMLQHLPFTCWGVQVGLYCRGSHPLLHPHKRTHFFFLQWENVRMGNGTCRTCGLACGTVYEAGVMVWWGPDTNARCYYTTVWQCSVHAAA